MREELSGRVRARVAAGVVLLVVGAGSAACGSGSTEEPSDGSGTDTSSSTGSSTGSPSDVVTIDITVSGGEITPNGAEVQVATGEEVELVVTADAPGEIHVHSDPESEFSYEGTGEPETFPLSIDRPGQVEVESHTLDKLIVKLVVS